MPHQPVPGGENQAALFGDRDAGRRAAVAGVRAQTNFNKHGHVAVAADQIDFTAAHAKVAFDDVQALRAQVVGRALLTGCACDLAARHRMRGMNDESGTVMAKVVEAVVENERALYVVATPIGNLADITLRALEILRRADLVACEDTRHARHLLDHHGIRTATLALHQHNENEAAQKLIAALDAGKCVALISDAGTPGVSDPGARAVAAVRAAGIRVVPLPGANAAIAAISAAGLCEVDDQRFLFVGFLPAKVGARRAAITELAPLAAALVFYEAPHRVLETVADLAALLPGREIIIARELTKLFEQIERLPLSDACAWLTADANRQRGEFVLIVSAPLPAPEATLDPAAERVLNILLAELPLKQAAKLAATISGAPKNTLYAHALALKQQPL